jgi:hypothetical protein
LKPAKRLCANVLRRCGRRLTTRWPRSSTTGWSLSDNSGHCWILARDGSVANDPSATLKSRITARSSRHCCR